MASHDRWGDSWWSLGQCIYPLHLSAPIWWCFFVLTSFHHFSSTIFCCLMCFKHIKSSLQKSRHPKFEQLLPLSHLRKLWLRPKRWMPSISPRTGARKIPQRYESTGDLQPKFCHGRSWLFPSTLECSTPALPPWSHWSRLTGVNPRLSVLS